MKKSKERSLSLNKIIALLAAIQFVNALDFMMVTPMGPDFSAALGIPLSKLGLIAGSYTAASAVSGFISSLFLDKYDRRSALVFSVFGLAVGTFLSVFATGLGSLVSARIVAGIFGGPAAAMCISVVTDLVPVERRGRVMGFIMGMFSIASILGVPAGLELARIYGWKAPFYCVGTIVSLIAILAWMIMPSMTSHLERASKNAVFASFHALKKTEVWVSHFTVFLAMFGAFLTVPNFSAYFQHNLGVERQFLSYLYMAGGVSSFIVILITGRLVDAFGSSKVLLFGILYNISIVYCGYYNFPPLIPPLAIFMGFMTSMTIRGISINTLFTKVPPMHERAGYMSFQMAVQHMACAVGAMCSTLILTESPEGMLVGMDKLALGMMSTTALLPVMVLIVERSLRKKALRTDPINP